MAMEMVYAAMLLHSVGKEITEEAVKKVVDATGHKADESKVKALVSSLKGVNIEEAISKASVFAAGPAPAASGAAPEEKKAEAHDDKADEKKAEEAAAGLGALFG
jgi:large subunit ribosomal protein L12